MATKSLAMRAAEAPAGVIKANRFLREICLETVGHAAFSLDLGDLARPEQKATKQYLHAFDVGERGPLFMKLLQLCPIQLQTHVSLVVSRMIGVDVSAMKNRIRTTLISRMKAMRDESLDNNLLQQDRQADLLDIICSRASPHLFEKALFRHTLTILAGSVEMVSNQLAWAIYALSHPKHQYIQDNLRSEIRNYFPSRPDSLSWEEVKALPYLTGVVNEILRLFPSVAHRFRVCNTPTTLLDQPIHKGTMITWPIYATNRNPSLWGGDADKFRRGRWAQDTGTNDKESKRDAYAFMTFGQGPRKCPGENYTRVVLACMLLDMVGHFQFKMPMGHEDVFEGNGREKIGFGIVMKAPIYAEIEEVPGWAQ